VIENGYSLETLNSGLEFNFLSTGPNGIIKKYILFKPMERVSDVFSMGFGDIMDNGSVNDQVVTNNQDLSLVVGALLASIGLFFERYPTKSVFIAGTTPSRTRLYRIIISKNFPVVQSRFRIFGLIDGIWEEFASNRSYDGYLIQIKMS
jgi:hypothetical protein